MDVKCRVDLGLKHMEKMGENTQIWAFRVFSTGRIGSPTGRSLLLVIFGQVLPVEVKSYR